MQSNIIEIFPTDHTENRLYRSLSEKMRYTVSCQDFSPLITPCNVRDNKNLQMSLVESLIVKLDHEVSLLYREGCSFLDKFEKILRIYYRLYKFNPELILLFQNISCCNDEFADFVKEEPESISQLKCSIRSVLEDQARKDGIIQEENGLEQLIFFMLEEVIKCFQCKLTSCCQDLIEHSAEEGFPSEEDMIQKFFKPIADQLGSLEAS